MELEDWEFEKGSIGAKKTKNRSVRHTWTMDPCIRLAREDLQTAAPLGERTCCPKRIKVDQGLWTPNSTLSQAT